MDSIGIIIDNEFKINYIHANTIPINMLTKSVFSLISGKIDPVLDASELFRIPDAVELANKGGSSILSSSSVLRNIRSEPSSSSFCQALDELLQFGELQLIG